MPYHHPASVTLNTGTSCSHPDDDRRDPRICFHPGDDRRGNEGRRLHSSDSTSGRCFRLADDTNGNDVGRSEDLAADLDRTLTAFERQHLTGLSSRS